MSVQITKIDKWIHGAIPSLLIHICVGSVYCWSLFKEDIASSMGTSIPKIEFAFSIAIFFLGMSAAFGGRFIEKHVKQATLLSTLFFCGGLVISVFAIRSGSILFFFLSYGVLMGIGLGIGYLSPIKTLMLWFDKNKGIGTGIVISGFGLSKALLAPFIVWCNTTHSVYATIIILSCGSLVCMSLAAIMIKKPNKWNEPEQQLSYKKILSFFSNSDYLKIWFFFYLNITCGLSLISFEKDICLTNGIIAIATISSLTALFNTLGRFGYSSISDIVTDKRKMYAVIFATSILSCLMYLLKLPSLTYSVIILLLIINAGYGGGFSCLPILLQSKYSMNNISTLHGVTLSAWAFAGISGNMLSSFLVDKLGLSYDYVVGIVAVLYASALILTLTIKKNKVK